MKVVLDTNILIDYLRGITAARTEFERYEQVFISTVTWMEVMVGAPDEVADTTERFLGTLGAIPVDDAVARRTVALRRAYRLKLPDAIIWASADIRSMLLVSRDTKAYPTDHPGIRVPYKLAS